MLLSVAYLFAQPRERAGIVRLLRDDFLHFFFFKTICTNELITRVHVFYLHTAEIFHKLKPGPFPTALSALLIISN